MRPEQIIAAMRPLLRGALVATDFDGTLAPLVDDPEESRPVPGAVEALTALAERGARIGLVTGRDAQTVLRLGGFDTIPGLVVEGLYGLEQWYDGALHSPDTPAAVEQLRHRVPALLHEHAGDDGVWVEDKRLSLVVHTRPAADPDAALDRLSAPAARLAAELGLDLHPGRRVLEFRLPGFNKGAALHRLVQRSAPSAVLYAGDDVGDLPAFAAVHQLDVPAWTLFAGSDEAGELAGAADAVVDGPRGVVGFLTELAG